MEKNFLVFLIGQERKKKVFDVRSGTTKKRVKTLDAVEIALMLPIEVNFIVNRNICVAACSKVLNKIIA